MVTEMSEILKTFVYVIRIRIGIGIGIGQTEVIFRVDICMPMECEYVPDVRSLLYLYL